MFYLPLPDRTPEQAYRYDSTDQSFRLTPTHTRASHFFTAAAAAVIAHRAPITPRVTECACHTSRLLAPLARPDGAGSAAFELLAEEPDGA